MIKITITKIEASRFESRLAIIIIIIIEFNSNVKMPIKTKKRIKD
jgi:hypothetical protein